MHTVCPVRPRLTHHNGYIESIFLLKGWSTECRANSGKYCDMLNNYATYLNASNFVKSFPHGVTYTHSPIF